MTFGGCFFFLKKKILFRFLWRVFYLFYFILFDLHGAYGLKFIPSTRHPIFVFFLGSIYTSTDGHGVGKRKGGSLRKGMGVKAQVKFLCLLMTLCLQDEKSIGI